MDSSVAAAGEYAATTVSSEFSRERRRSLRWYQASVASRIGEPASWMRTIAAASSAGSAVDVTVPF